MLPAHLYKPTQLSVMLAGICSLMLAMGIGRYSFTPMIPQMQAELGLSESLAGWLAGWSYIGYLTGLFIVWLMRDLKLKDYFYRYGLFLAVFSTAIMGISDHRLLWYVSRFFAGIGCALGFILGTGLVMKWLIHHHKKPEMGLHFSGLGLGIVLSALVVNYASSNHGLDLSWRMQWLVLAGVGFLLSIPAMLLLPFPGEEQIANSKVIDHSEEPSKRWLIFMTIAYCCAGFSNSVNVTFTALITEYVPLVGQGSVMWMYAGIAAAVAPYLWDKMATQFGYLNALCCSFILNVLSNLMMSHADSFIMVLISVVSFGFAFMGIVSLVLSTIGRYYGARSTQIMSQLTLGYCIAQIISPIVSGILAEWSGDFSYALYLISCIMVIGLMCLLAIKNEYRGNRQAKTENPALDAT